MNGQVNRGIYDDFHGYRLPTEDELNSALQSALVVLDTNVLLNLYRYNRSTRNDLLEVMRSLGERLWVPHQVMREFWRNRVSVLGSRGAGTEQALNALDKQQRAAAEALHQWAKTTAIEVAERDALINKITTLYGELEQIIQIHAPAAPTTVGGASDEPVLRELEALLDRKAVPRQTTLTGRPLLMRATHAFLVGSHRGTSMPKRSIPTFRKAPRGTFSSGIRHSRKPPDVTSMYC